MPQSTAQIQAELDEWYKARSRLASGGKSVQISTSAGARMITFNDVDEVNRMIDKLERQLKASKQPNKRNPMGFMVGNFNR